MQFSPQKQRFIYAATEMFGGGSVINKQQVRDASAKAGTPLAGWFMKQFKTGYNQFKLPKKIQNTLSSLPLLNTDKIFTSRP